MGWCSEVQAAAAAKSLQLCPTLCDPIDGSPPGSSVHGTLQARGLEWGAIAFSNEDPANHKEIFFNSLKEKNMNISDAP